MPDKKNANKMRLWAAVGLISLFCLLTALFFNIRSTDYFVENNDNYGIASVTSDLKYNNYCIFLNPLLCSLIRNTASLLPGADAFAVVSLILCQLAFIWMSYLVLKHTGGLKRLIFITVIAAYASIAVCIQNFTVIAAFLLFAGIAPALAMLIRGQKKWLYIFISAFFAGLGYMYRADCLLLFVPFAAVCCLVPLLCGGAVSGVFKNALSVFIPVLAVTAILGGISHMVNNTPDIKAAVEFNTLRSNVQDYPLLPYDKAKAALPDDFTENDYTLITHFMTPDTARMDTEFMRSFAAAAIDSSPNRAKIITQTIEKNKYSLKSLLLFACALAAACFIAANEKSILKRLLTLLCFLGIAAACLVFLYLGRLPERVMLSIMTAGLAALCAILYNTDIKNTRAGLAVLIALFCFAAARYAVNDMGGRPDTLFTAKISDAALEEPVSATYTDGCVFVWDTINYSLAPSMYFSTHGKLLPDRFKMHNIPAGGWSYKQIYQRQAFADMGIQNPAYDLVYRPGTYYVGELSVMETYIKQHIEPNIRAEKIGYILNTPVYKFTLAE